MKTIVTSCQMRDMERNYMENTHTESDALMLRAARAMTDEICLKLDGCAGRTCVFACGNGGNGGDGYAAARMFAEGGGRSIILDIMPDLPRRPDAARMRRWALEHASVWQGSEFSNMPRPNAWVDCVFGIGLNRAPSDDIAALFARIESDRKEGSLVFSCDIPSGLNADTGNAPGAYVQADCTVTFECAKPGHYLGLGMDACGDVVVRSIGIGREFFPQDTIRLIEPHDISPACAKRPHNCHKGTFGHLLIVAGSFGMAGAAALCAGAALRSGAGLVTIACPASIVPILQTLAPCAMCFPLPEENGAISAQAVPVLIEALKNKTAVAIGPGLSTRCAPDILKTVLESGIPCLIDADGLNILSQNDTLRPLLHKNCLITPHPGEAARLADIDMRDPVCAADKLHAMGCTVLYKGAATVICGESGHFLSISGTPGMARGGSGDILTGIAGALIARGFDAETAAWTASEAHGLAGEIAAERFGETGMTAQDLLSSLPEVWKNAR